MATKRDYYEVLGVERTSSEQEIKRAYRRLAMENHPDRNPGDAAAEQRFKEAADAYAVLSDQEKRSKYDQFGHAGVDGTFGGAPGGFADISDIFAAFGDIFGRGGGGSIFDQFFGGGRERRARRGTSLRVDLELTLEDVARGVKKTLEIARHMPCETCGGNGCKPGTQPQTCDTCGGHGEVVRGQGFIQIRQTCPSCNGRGSQIQHRCPPCRGTGLTRKKSPISITIPPGIEEGHVERIHGQGEAGPTGGPPGDLVVVIHVKPHKMFERRGDDLLVGVTISYCQAVTGDSVDLPTITGDTVVLKIPPGTQPGTRLRVRSQGLPRIDGYGKGNMVVQVQVAVPSKITPEQEKHLKQFDAIEQERSKKRKKGIFEKVKNIFQ
ncbi:MAG: molecular chaperone DnaJ [Planctomycetota bacterium]|jgi:molecular chaperone DnaJ